MSSGLESAPLLLARSPERIGKLKWSLGKLGKGCIDSQGILPASALFLLYYLNLADVLMQSTSLPRDSKQSSLAQMAKLGEFCPQHFYLLTHCPGDIESDNTEIANHDT